MRTRLLLLASLVVFAAPVPGHAQSPCATMTDPAAIVACEQERAGGPEAMRLDAPDHEIVVRTVLRQTAASLNAAGIPGGPFGLLVKTGGTNCGGYSCDIICSGQGPGQRQWDVFGDVGGRSSPRWDGPLTTIVVRPCEFVAGHVPTPTPQPVPAPVPSPDLTALLARVSALESKLAEATHAYEMLHDVQAVEIADLRSKLAALPGTPVELPLYTGKGLFGVRVISRPCNPNECK